MSSYNYNDYLENQQNSSAAKAPLKQSFPKVGFFKLKNDGDIALARFNISSTDDLSFATGHTISINGKWMRVSCLNPINKFRSADCPLCAANAEGNTAISIASKKVYIQMLVSYQDESGNMTPAEPVVWERPDGFSREIANLLKDFGSLKEHVFKITRNGAAGDMKTTYSINYVPLYDKPEFIPTDLSAFDNFNIARHSYWEKTEDEIRTYLETGSFPVVVSNDATANVEVPAPKTEPAYYTQPVQKQAPVEPVQEASATKSSFTGSENYPSRNFNGFSF